MESEKERHARQVGELNDTIQGKEKELMKMEEKVKAMGEERASLLSKQKELHWEKDQESKRLAKEISKLNEKSELERADHLQLIEKLKSDIKERYASELTQKENDAARSESMMRERVALLEKEVSKLEVQLLQSKTTLTELREKGETMRQKCDSLQMELFKANDFERKSGIEL